MTDKQYKSALTTVGMWAFLKIYEMAKLWDGNDKHYLVGLVFNLGLDSDEAWSQARVNAVLRIINGQMDRRALEDCRDSARLNHSHPEAHDMAEALINRYF